MVYAGEFSLTAEVSAICVPLAERVSTHPNPRTFGGSVVVLADAGHELVSTVVGWLADIDARREHAERLEHLDSASRATALRHLVDLAPRPPAPDIGVKQLSSGSWAAALVAMANPYSDPLSELLGRSLPPNDPRLRGLTSRSEKLLDLLREVDLAARDLEVRLDRAATATRPTSPQNPMSRAEMARAELRKMGIEPS